MQLTEALKEEYRSLFRTCQITSPNSVKQSADKLARNMATYEHVSRATGCPAPIVGCIHSLEASFDFGSHLHNGDPLTSRTTHVPAGRPVASPKNGVAYTWEESAIDALLMAGTRSIQNWEDIAVCLHFLEGYNGFGYRGRNTTPPSRSPYLWSMTNQWSRGKFTSDGKFDPQAGSLQVGAGALLKALENRGLLNLDSGAARPAAVLRGYRAAKIPLSFDRILREGDTGEDVFVLKCALIGLGYLPQTSSVDNTFDSSTVRAVTALQTNARIEVDGEAGDDTAGAISELLAKARGLHPAPVLNVETTNNGNGQPTSIRAKVTSFARETAKKGRSHSPGNIIDRLVLDPTRPALVAAGHLGSSQTDSFFDWCACWVHYVLRECGVKVPMHPQGYFATIALVDTWRFMAKKIGAFKKNGNPGDIVVYDWDGDQSLNHIGIVIAVKNGIITSAEGNRHNLEDLGERSASLVGGFIDIEVLAARAGELIDQFVPAHA